MAEIKIAGTPGDTFNVEAKVDLTDGVKSGLFTIPQPNLPPVVGSPTASVVSSGSGTINLFEGASDPEGATLTVTDIEDIDSNITIVTSIPADVGEGVISFNAGVGTGVAEFTFKLSDGVSKTSGTATVTVTAAATVPDTPAAPTVEAVWHDEIEVSYSTVGHDGGSAVTQRDLRYSTDESSWTTVADIEATESISGLTDETLYYVQTRAVNAVGAGGWSASASDTTQEIGDVGSFPTIATQNIPAGTSFDLSPDWGAGLDYLEVLTQPTGDDWVGTNGGDIFFCLTLDTSTESSKSVQIRAHYLDASTADGAIDYNRLDSLSPQGWDIGRKHVLPTDPTTDLTVFWPGLLHKRCYVTGGTSWDVSEIQAVEGGTINGEWLYNNLDSYGTVSDPLSESAAVTLLNYLATLSGNDFWWYFERGYSYGTFELRKQIDGANARHPMVVRAYGSGNRPYLTQPQSFTLPGASDIAYVSCRLSGLGNVIRTYDSSLRSRRFLVEDVDFDGAGEINWQGMEKATMRYTCVRHSVKHAPANGSTWSDTSDKHSGMYSAYAKDIHYIGTLWDHNGWGDGYDFNESGSFPQTWASQSHNTYNQGKLDNRTTHGHSIAGGFNMRGPGTAAQLRAGSAVWDNVVFEGQGGYLFGGSSYCSVWDRSVQIGAACKIKYSDRAGGTGKFNAKQHGHGVGINSPGGSVHEVLVAHTEDPDYAGTEPIPGSIVNLPAAFQTKRNVYQNTGGAACWPIFGSNGSGDPIKLEDASYDLVVRDIVIHSWRGSGSFSEGTPDSGIINTRTVRRYAEHRADITSGLDAVDDFADWLHAQWKANEGDNAFNLREEAEIMADWFLEARFVTPRTNLATNATIYAEARLGFDGLRWDYPRNWSNYEVPGMANKLNVDCGGLPRTYQVGYTYNTSVDMRDAPLWIFGGMLKTDSLIDAPVKMGFQDIDDYGGWAAALETGSFSGTLIMSEGWYFNVGDQTSACDVTVSGGEFFFALAQGSGASWTIPSGSVVELIGDVIGGIDGSSGAAAGVTVSAGAALKMTASGGVLPVIKESRSGRNDLTDPNVAFAFTCDGTLEVSVSGVSAGTYDLVIADTVSGTFDTETITGGSGSISYTATKVQITVT